MAFYAYLEQGCGCDYTIGCGKLLVELKETSFEGAQEELWGEYGCRHYLGGEADLASIRVFQASEVRAVNLVEWKTRLAEQEKAEKAARDAAKDRAEYERLKAKFGP